MESLPIAASCGLHQPGVRAQRERYRRAGDGARLVEHTRRRLVVDLDQHADTRPIEQAIAIERECCPFFDLRRAPSRKRVSVSVSQRDQEPALDAIAFALGVTAPVQRGPSG